MTISAQSSLADVAFTVCTALHEAGITAVLTGGSAATFYAPESYQSLDLDFVITLHGGGGKTVLEGLGYLQKGDFYEHKESAYPLEFPPGPLAIGNDLVKTWVTERRRDQRLHVLSPTDCCRDRLAAFLFWNDFSGLEQALAVYRARSSEIDLKLIENWCRRERHEEKYRLFLARSEAGEP